MMQFNLESALTEWRQRMLAAGIETPVPLDELEAHLLDDIEQQMRSGMDALAAFETTVQRIGQAGPIKMEFKKIEERRGNRPLVWIAWALFVISLFLPAYVNGSGWACAALSVEAWTWPEVRRGEWLFIHLALLTFANLLMLASPFFPAKFLWNARSLRWLQFSNFAAFTLVWSYFLTLFFCNERQHLRIGCYVWTASFLVLFLSSVRWQKKQQQYAC